MMPAYPLKKRLLRHLVLGFRCGFLGLLHMEVFKQRLEQEYNLSVIATAPSVLYQIKMAGTAKLVDIENPSDFPERNILKKFLNQ